MGRIIAAATSLSLIAVGLFSIMTAAKTSPANSSQEKEKKAPVLRWDPPHVGAPVPSLSATPSCFLPDVLKQAGQLAEELVDHLQKFIAHEQIRYQQTDRQGMPEIYLAPKVEYLVDFGKQFEPLGKISCAKCGNLVAQIRRGVHGLCRPPNDHRTHFFRLPVLFCSNAGNHSEAQ